MAMWDCDVLVLLIVAGNWILEAFRAQALLQLCRGCQINFIAADAFLGRISFKGEKKEFLVCCTRNGNMGRRSFSKAIKRNLKFNQSHDAIQYFFVSAFGLLCMRDTKTWNSIFFLSAEHETEIENRLLMTKIVFLWLFFRNLEQRTMNEPSCVFMWARRLHASANFFKQISHPCGLSPATKRRKKRKIVNQSADKFFH